MKQRDVIVWGGIGEKKSNGGTQWYLQNRIYDINGLSPALTRMKSDYWINMTDKDLNCINPWKHQAQKVYKTDGLATTLSANGGGQGGKTGLYLVEDNMDKKVIDDNFTEVEKDKYVTTDKERESCYAVTPRPRSRPLSKKPDNYVLEECIGSTQKHAARTDGTEAPTLTCAMGQGGGHIPMLKLRESTKKGYKEAKEGDGVELSRSHCSVRRGVSHDDSTGALNTQEGSWGTVTNDYRIRKLTPKECERLQAFPDDWTKYGKDDELISDTQRYKCCGNAVTTSVITAIVNEMFESVK